MTDTNGMRPITIRLGGRRTTVRINMDNETHRKAWRGLERLRDEYEDNSDTDNVRVAVSKATRKRMGTWSDVIQTLRTEWTQTEEPLSEATVIRECLRRAGQQVEGEQP